MIHSANGPSLRTIAQRMSEFGVDCLLRARVRDGKPSVHYQLEIVRRENLRWFVRNIGKRSRLHRKNRYLREELLQKIPAGGSRPNSRSPKGEIPADLTPPQGISESREIGHPRKSGQNQVGSAGFEPATFAVSGRRPNQASPTLQGRLRRRAPVRANRDSVSSFSRGPIRATYRH